MRRSQIRALPDHVQVEGNKGGSYVRLASTEKEGVCALEVGETCVVTVRQEVPVTWLAMILTGISDRGFDVVAAEYAARHHFEPAFMEVR